MQTHGHGHGHEGQGTAGEPPRKLHTVTAVELVAREAATQQGTPPGGKPGKPAHDERLEEACRKLVEAAHELSWATYLLGACQMPTGRADAARVRGLCHAAYGLVVAVEGVVAPLEESGALLPMFDEEAVGELADAGALLAFDMFTELAGHGARLEKLGRR